MKLTKKLTLATLATVVGGTTTFGSVSALAVTTGDAPVPVTYNNMSIIPDPDQPQSTNWAVGIPSAIIFTDEKDSIDVPVQLYAYENGKPTDNLDALKNSTPDLSLQISVKSNSSYQLSNILGNNNQEYGEYELSYEGKPTYTGNSDNVIGTLHIMNKTVINGTAKLTNKATSEGYFQDILTYTIQRQS